MHIGLYDKTGFHKEAGQQKAFELPGDLWHAVGSAGLGSFACIPFLPVVTSLVVAWEGESDDDVHCHHDSSIDESMCLASEASRRVLFVYDA